jgi:hypothetical protein
MLYVSVFTLSEPEVVEGCECVGEYMKDAICREVKQELRSRFYTRNRIRDLRTDLESRME